MPRDNEGAFQRTDSTRRHRDAPPFARDAPERGDELRALLQRKGAVRAFYADAYSRLRACVEQRCPPAGAGVVLEIGSGAGFCREALGNAVPDIVTSDVIAYDGVDRVVDALAMPFGAASVRAMFGLNVFHHLPDARRFLSEVERCLVDGGRLLLIDQYPGFIGGVVYRFLHHEPFDASLGNDWRCASHGPLSGANGALAWIVFERDRALFERRFPGLRLVRFEPHTPLRYWLAGGLKPWSLLPNGAWATRAAKALDDVLMAASPRFGSFVDVEIVRVPR